MAETIELVIDVEELRREIAEVNQDVENMKENAEEAIQTVEAQSTAAFQEVLTMARGAYLLSLGTVKAMGGSVTYMFRSMVSGAFATISALYAITHAKLLTTKDFVSFGLEMAQLGLAVAATIAAQAGQQAAGRSLMGAKMSLMGLNQLIGVMSF